MKTATDLAAQARVKQSIRERFVLYTDTYNMSVEAAKKEIMAEIAESVKYAIRFAKVWESDDGIIAHEINNVAVSGAGDGNPHKSDACLEIIKRAHNHIAMANVGKAELDRVLSTCVIRAGLQKRGKK